MNTLDLRSNLSFNHLKWLGSDHIWFTFKKTDVTHLSGDWRVMQRVLSGTDSNGKSSEPRRESKSVLFGANEIEQSCGLADSAWMLLQKTSHMSSDMQPLLLRASFFLAIVCISCSLQPPARLCEESGFCSQGIVKTFTGDIKNSE